MTNRNRVLLAGFMTLFAAVIVGAQSKKAPDISTVASAGVVEGTKYTNSFFKLSVDAPNATLQLNPVVNTKGQYARLLQVDSKPATWEATYALSISADSLAINPQVQSPVQYVRSIRHQLEREGLPTVREEFPITIAGVQFTGAVVEQQVQGRKYYRGIYASFRNNYVLTFDVEAASPDQLSKVVTSLVKLVN